MKQEPSPQEAASVFRFSFFPRKDAAVMLKKWFSLKAGGLFFFALNVKLGGGGRL